MLDTGARKYVQPILDKAAKPLIKIGLSPNQITLIAFAIGVMSSLSLYFEKMILAVVLLWLSGLLDAVDGTVARLTGKQSIYGAFLDVFLDRVVELGIIWVIAIKVPSSRLALVFLTSSILLSMTVFLLSGMVIENNTKKSFKYQAGLMERTEGFIAFTTMMIFYQSTVPIIIFTALVTITIIQRLLATKRCV